MPITGASSRPASAPIAADSAQAEPNTVLTPMPISRAAVWLNAAARIALPSRVCRKNSASKATSTAVLPMMTRYAGLTRSAPTASAGPA